jgi:predicted transposase YdaD
MKPIISKNLTPLPPFPTREWGFQSLSPRRGEVWRGVNLYIQNFSNILLGLGVMLLTTLGESQAPAVARYLLTRTHEEIVTPSSQAMMEMITTIMVYKFENLSRREVESMLGITLKETRVYQEVKEEGRKEGREEGLEEGLEQGIEQGIEQATINLVIRLLTKRFGRISQKIRKSISALPLSVVEELSEALLDFQSLDDLQTWLLINTPSPTD